MKKRYLLAGVSGVVAGAVAAGGVVASGSSKGLVPSVEASSALAGMRPPSTVGAGTKLETAARSATKGEYYDFSKWKREKETEFLKEENTKLNKENK